MMTEKAYFYFKRGAQIWVALQLLGLSLRAEGEGCCSPPDETGVTEVMISVEGTAGLVNVQLLDVDAAVFLINTSPTIPAAGTLTLDKSFIDFRYDREYQLILTGNGRVTDWHVLIEPESGYQIEIDDRTRTAMDVAEDDVNATVVLRSPKGEFGSSTGFYPQTRKVSFALGYDQPDGTPVGSLSLELEPTLLANGQFSAASFDPATLNFYADTTSPYVDVRGSQTNWPWQIKVASGLVEVDEDTVNSCYDIRFYKGPFTDTGTLFEPLNAAFVSYTIEKPANWATQLDFYETRGTPLIKHQTLTNTDANNWGMTDKNNVRKYSVSKTAPAATLTQSLLIGDVVQTFITRNANDDVLATTKKTIRGFAWGDEVVQTDVLVGGTTWLTSLVNYDGTGPHGANHISYGRPVSEVASDGTWVAYHYVATSSAYATGPEKEVRKWTDLSSATPVTSSPTTTHERQFTYGGSGFEDGPTNIVEYTLNLKTSGASRALTRPNIGGTVFDLMTTRVTPGTDPAGLIYPDLVTNTARYPHSATLHLAGKVRFVQNPDATKMRYTYERGSYNEVTDVFTVNSGGDMVRTTIEHGYDISPGNVGRWHQPG